jgi:starvation-inducible DNA-binding protein
MKRSALPLVQTLNAIRADAVALSLKTRSCYWQMIRTPGRDDYHPLGEHGNRLIAISNLIAKRVRRQGGSPRSIGHGIRGSYDSADWPGKPSESFAELMEVNRTFSVRWGEAHKLCADYGDTATAALVEFWLAKTEHRLSFLFEALRREGQCPD